MLMGFRCTAHCCLNKLFRTSVRPTRFCDICCRSTHQRDQFRTGAYQNRKDVNPNNKRGDEYGPLWPVPVSIEEVAETEDEGA